jgi:hypothetical protein
MVSSAVRISNTVKRIDIKKMLLLSSDKIQYNDIQIIEAGNKQMRYDMMENKKRIEAHIFDPDLYESLRYAKRGEAILQKYENMLDGYMQKL